MRLAYDRGTVVAKDASITPTPHFRWDPRTEEFRALACKYREIVEYLRAKGVEFEDLVMDPVEGELKVVKRPSLRPYQKEALKAWLERKRGIVVLPTGAGKTRVALAAIAELKCPTLVVVPTLELMDQWERRIARYFSTDIGRFGGGDREIGFVTVATYDSAYLNAEFLGNKFLFVVFDEVHHLPSTGYRQIAELLAAPYRLGLTATPEREDGAHALLPELVGPIVYEKRVRELTGRYLADFDVVTIRVRLREDERERYRRALELYRKYSKKAGIRIRSLEDFQRLIARSGLNKYAREAILAWREARKISMNAERKIEALKEILEKHRGDRVLIFAESNEVVRRISLELLIPEISYKTSEAERKAVLEAFREGKVNAIVTSRVLEEGIDVPDANVAVVLSGTASRRQFIQRLGRVLRPKNGKRAVLYEIVTSGTREVEISRKRRRGV